MARRTPPPPEPQARQFTSAREIDQSIFKLRRRYEEVEALDRVRFDDQRVDNAESNIVSTIRDVFGPNSAEFREHQYHRISYGPMYINQPEGYSQECFVAGRVRTLGMLNGLIERLNEKKADLEQPHEQPRAEFRSRSLHPMIVNEAERLFDDGHCAEAVFRASVALIDAVKQKSGRQDLDGANLMRNVFSRNNPRLAFNALADQSDYDEQEGLMHLFEGAALAVRNPRGHRPGVTDDPQFALECLSLLSMLAGRLDAAIVRP
jgi:uncharacterized protein (TIGR02391 family)